MNQKDDKLLWARLTPSSWSPSSRWRGITVTSSISHRNAVSGGVKPGGNGRAIVQRNNFEAFKYGEPNMVIRNNRATNHVYPNLETTLVYIYFED